MITSFDQYKKLTEEERDFYNFEQLRKIDFVHEKFKLLDKKYASKRVETIVYGFIGLVITGFVIALISKVL